MDMDIIKNLKDYKLTTTERIMSGYLQNKADMAVCVEKIVNKEFIMQFLEPKNEFLIYTTAVANPAMVLRYYPVKEVS